ncbi:STE-domain-containing protein [Hesseltinella vesiculosa]|uniref:STE-domain-containing protein n=1 Tax=Hesseltinella vesiculosa TaxID=101127 RepID=A0A1X2GNG8_9FUNG|nr:STE-domain-containing protein [Hesseltinella vesiculosa]
MNSLRRPSDNDYKQRILQIEDLKYFLSTANDRWCTPVHSPQYQICTFPLPTGDQISCVLWNNLYYITGTDIVRSLVFRFHAFGRPVQNLKKFEEGVFSDLRNLKPGQDASLEEPRSEFLDVLYKNNCIRTKKKQKVFYWFSVPHDRLFLDALERDLKREKLGIEATSCAVSNPALSLTLDSTQEAFEQIRKSFSLLPFTTLFADK